MYKFPTALKANERIAALEQTLGIPPSDVILNMSAAHRRIAQLEEALAKRPAPAPARSTPATTSAAAPAPAGARTLTRAQLFSLAAVFPMLTVEPEVRDQDLRRAVAKAAFQAHHVIPGLTDDAALTGKLWRGEQPKGVGQYMHSLRQDRIDAILKK